MLSRAHYDRAAHLRNDETWLAEAWESAAAQVIVLSNRMTTPVRTSASGSAVLVPRRAAGWPGADRAFLGLVGEVPWFAVTVGEDQLDPEPAGSAGDDGHDAEQWLGLRDLAPVLAEPDAGLLASAVALAEWHARHQRCPRCGAATRPAKGGWTGVCTADGSEHFPRTDAAVIMLVHDGAGHCVLGRQPVWPPGRYSVLAGFVEPGSPSKRRSRVRCRKRSACS